MKLFNCVLGMKLQSTCFPENPLTLEPSLQFQDISLKPSSGPFLVLGLSPCPPHNLDCPLTTLAWDVAFNCGCYLPQSTCQQDPSLKFLDCIILWPQVFGMRFGYYWVIGISLRQIIIEGNQHEDISRKYTTYMFDLSQKTKEEFVV